MAAKSLIPVRRHNPAHRLLMEKNLLERSYSFLDIKISNGILYCNGTCRPSELSTSYEYQLQFKPGEHPKVYTFNPVIPYSEDIHMYSSDNRLCLYYPNDYSFTSTSHLYNTIIPWTHEWFIFYELYLITGIWKHPYVDHKRI